MVQLGAHMPFSEAKLWGAVPAREQGLSLEQTHWVALQHAQVSKIASTPLAPEPMEAASKHRSGLTSHLTLPHPPHSSHAPLSSHTGSLSPPQALCTCCSLHLGHTAPVPHMASFFPNSSLSCKVTAQASLSRWSLYPSYPLLSLSLCHVFFSLNSSLVYCLTPVHPSIHTLRGKLMKAGQSCLSLLSPSPQHPAQSRCSAFIDIC